jgi:tetratricopeptide (TPR) repeat protein
MRLSSFRIFDSQIYGVAMAKIEKRPKGWLVGKQQVEDWLALATRQMMREDYDGALRTCKRILHYVPKKDKVTAEALGIIGMMYAMQKEFERSYQTLTQALEIDPGDALLYYNRGLSALYTSRMGQSLQDLEQAVLLEGNGKMAAQFQEKAKFARKLAASELALRGKDFKLEQLIEQQELFHEGNRLSAEGKWQEAEEYFRKSIAMADCLPQPQGNLGICLAMQNRFDEAEAAYKRAMEIEPGYKRAKENLKNLNYLRAHPNEKPGYRITSPFQDAKTGIKFVK